MALVGSSCYDYICCRLLLSLGASAVVNKAIIIHTIPIFPFLRLPMKPADFHQRHPIPDWILLCPIAAVGSLVSEALPDAVYW